MEDIKVPAAIYGIIEGQGQTAPTAVRPFHLYDAAYEWFHVANPSGRHGIGVIGRGRDGGGRDLLLPSLDWIEDLCVYNLGALYFRDTGCPKFTIGSDLGMDARDLAVYYHTRQTSVLNDMPIGLYCASSARSTYKYKARDYDTYDQYFGRTQGIAGTTQTSTIESPSALYGDIPHGSQFNFEVISMSGRPSVVALWAVRNLSVLDVYWRFAPGGFNDTSAWSDYTFTVTSSGGGRNYYSRTHDIGKVFVPYMSIRSYGTMNIDGETHNLVMVTVDWPYTSYAHKNFEAPYYRLYPTEDPSIAGGCSAYLLDEWVTIHKPYNY